MGYAGGYQALHRPRVCQQRDSDADGTAHNEQPSEESGVCPQQERADYRRLWQRQDPILAQAQPDAVPFVLCGDRPEGQPDRRVRQAAETERLPHQGDEHDQLRQVHALQSCDLFAAEKVAHSAVSISSVN